MVRKAESTFTTRMPFPSTSVAHQKFEGLVSPSLVQSSNFRPRYTNGNTHFLLFSSPLSLVMTHLKKQKANLYTKARLCMISPLERGFINETLFTTHGASLRRFQSNFVLPTSIDKINCYWTEENSPITDYRHKPLKVPNIKFDVDVWFLTLILHWYIRTKHQTWRVFIIVCKWYQPYPNLT